MRRIFVVEIDDSQSDALQRDPRKNLKYIFRTIADQAFWGDTQRDVRDRNGVTVGQWHEVEPAGQTVV